MAVKAQAGHRSTAVSLRSSKGFIAAPHEGHAPSMKANASSLSRPDGMCFVTIRSPDDRPRHCAPTRDVHVPRVCRSAGCAVAADEWPHREPRDH
jgi:hypothetical protein